MIKNQFTVFMMFWLSLDFIHREREYSFDILLPFISRCRIKREGEIEIDGQSESARIKRTQIISASKRNNPVRIVVVETTKSNFLHKYEIVTVYIGFRFNTSSALYVQMNSAASKKSSCDFTLCDSDLCIRFNNNFYYFPSVCKAFLIS